MGRGNGTYEVGADGQLKIKFVKGIIVLQTLDSSAEYDDILLKRKGKRVTLKYQGKSRSFVVPVTYSCVSLTEEGDLYRDEELIEKGVVPAFPKEKEAEESSELDRNCQQS